MTTRIKALIDLLSSSTSISDTPAFIHRPETGRTTRALMDAIVVPKPDPRVTVMLARGKRFGLHQIGSLFGGE